MEIREWLEVGIELHEERRKRRDHYAGKERDPRYSTVVRGQGEDGRDKA